jgi:hypothetical protein
METHFANAKTRWMNETYFSDAGRTVLTRGYESRSGDQYAYLEPEAEVTTADETYRLLGDMIPDFVFAGPAEPEPFAPPFNRFGRK